MHNINLSVSLGKIVLYIHVQLKNDYSVKAGDIRGPRNRRLVNGRNADPGEFPHQVSLQWGYLPHFTYRHFCGGSIINESWILTAAHCLASMDDFAGAADVFIVKAGKYNITATEDGEQMSFVDYYIKHENYTQGGL